MSTDNMQLARISENEARMTEAQALLAAGQINERLAELIRALETYYTSSAWKQDFADDEAGLLPADLKRGVLSEDGIYDLLETYQELTKTPSPRLVITRVVKDSFVVIGKEGSTAGGDGFIQKLWQEANSNFEQVAHLAKRDENGNLVGIWGAMSDFTHSFKPWDGFRAGLYLAGVECVDDAEAPEGWVKWVVPGYEFLCVENKEPETFNEMMQYMQEQNLSLAGAAHDFTCPATGKNYIFLPIRKL